MIKGKHVILRLFSEEEVDEYVKLENDYAELGEFLDPYFHSQMARRGGMRTKGAWSSPTKRDA